MNSRHSRRYARSIVDLATEQGKLDQTYEDAGVIIDAIDESRDLRSLLDSPIVKSDRKRQILKALFEGKVGDVFMKFIDLIVSKGREDDLRGICDEVQNLYRQKFGILNAQVTTAVELEDEMREKVRNLVAQLGDRVELTEKVDPDILGGIVIRVGDRQIDASISRQLADLKREFSKNPALV